MSTTERQPPVESVARALRPLLAAVLGERLPVRFEFWDGSSLGPDDARGSLRLNSPDAIRHVLWAPGELGVARAFVAGDVDFTGPILDLTLALNTTRPGGPKLGPAMLPHAARAARKLKLVGRPPRPPAEEARPRGRRHSIGRDSQAVTHHYDVGNDFYRIVLGPSMVYSCARFVTETATLEDAQAQKLDLICRKLSLHERPSARLLDVGCGWGSMAIHAASRYGAEVVGVTLSEPQAELARKRAVEAGVADRVEIRVQDYRLLARSGERFDAVSSIGMFEHVGKARMATYFTTLRGLLEPQGRLLNHAISSVGGSVLAGRSFVSRYVFPDGELLDVGDVVLAMEQAGFEVRDVESLREHYALTLRAWVGNLEANWDAAVALVGEARARVWLLYMAASVNGFDDGGLGLHQVLGVVPDGGQSGMPLTRTGFEQ